MYAYIYISRESEGYLHTQASDIFIFNALLAVVLWINTQLKCAIQLFLFWIGFVCKQNCNKPIDLTFLNTEDDLTDSDSEFSVKIGHAPSVYRISWRQLCRSSCTNDISFILLFMITAWQQ
jgi:hypothetical protein